METVEGQLGIPDPAKMAKTVSTEEQMANSAATNQQQKQQPPQKPKDQHESVAEKSQQPAAPTSIKFCSLKTFLKEIFIICLSYNSDNIDYFDYVFFCLKLFFSFSLCVGNDW